MKFLGIFIVAIWGCVLLSSVAHAEDEVNTWMGFVGVRLLGDDRIVPVLICSLSLSCGVQSVCKTTDYNNLP